MAGDAAHAVLGILQHIGLFATVLPEEIERCRAVGMNAHIAKRGEREALLDTVQRWLRPAAMEREPALVPELSDAD